MKRGILLVLAHAGFYLSMNEVMSAVAEAMARLDDAGRRVCVGLSGGLDSVALLAALHELGPRHIELSAIHVDHGLNPKSRQWAKFCADLCDRLGIGLTLTPVSVDLKAGLGPEAAARRARYEAFSNQDEDYLALAHHADDQVETFFIQLMRGGGAPGLSAMPVERAAFTGRGPRLLRPFLSLTRTNIREFASSRGLDWIEDDSNDDLSLDRNFIRHTVLPLLDQRFPAYRATVDRAIQNIADAGQLVDILGEHDLQTLRENGSDESGVQIAGMRDWPQSRALNALRSMFRVEGISAPHRSRLGEALRQLLHARQDAVVCIDCGEFSLRRYRNRVYLVQNLDVPRDWLLRWGGEDMITLPNGLGRLRFSCALGPGVSTRALRNNDVHVAFRRGGERMALAKNRPHRALGKHYQEAGIAPWLRERSPLLLCGKEIVCVPGLGVAAEYQAAPGEESVTVDWIQTS